MVIVIARPQCYVPFNGFRKHFVQGITPCEGRVEHEVHGVMSCCQGINQRSNWVFKDMKQPLQAGCSNSIVGISKPETSFVQGERLLPKLLCIWNDG
jgi:hypothetical protein